MLNEKQKAFCEEYIIDFNATESAIKVGYSSKTAYSIGQRLLKNVEVQEYIQELKVKRSERVQITQDEVLKDIIELKNRCMQACPVTFMGKPVKDKNGHPLWKFDSKGAAKALEMLGKHIGFFNEDNKQKQPILNPVQTIYKTVKEQKEVKKHIKDFINND